MSGLSFCFVFFFILNFLFFSFIYSKTTVVKRLLRQDVHQISPTVGFSIESLVYHDNEVSQDYHLSLVDVGGQKSIRSFWRNYFEACDGIIWVVDACDVERIRECKEMLDGVLKQEVSFLSYVFSLSLSFLSFSHSSLFFSCLFHRN